MKFFYSLVKKQDRSKMYRNTPRNTYMYRNKYFMDSKNTFCLIDKNGPVMRMYETGKTAWVTLSYEQAHNAGLLVNLEHRVAYRKPSDLLHFLKYQKHMYFTGRNWWNASNKAICRVTDRDEDATTILDAELPAF